MGVSSHSSKPSTLSAKVLKVMSLFSGVHIVGILCSIIRTKLVAIWLGPVGIGLLGIYNSALETISSVTQLGTGTGVIRALAASPRQALPRLVVVIRRWGLGFGLLGALATLCLSPWLSQITFGDNQHAMGFILLSIAIFLLALSNNETSIFQGLKRYRKLAKVTVLGVIFGLVFSIPLYYYMGIDSVLPSILVYATATWICRGLYREKVEKPAELPTIKQTIIEGKEFAILGLFLTITTFATNAVSYIFMSYLNRGEGTEVAGFYQAGFTLVNRYIGIILAAVGMEYLPRLSEVHHSRRRVELFLSHEIVLLMLVIFPVVTAFIAADQLIINLLYDSRFITILPFITWAIIGTIFRAWSWCIAYLILAKNDGVAYLITELLSSGVAIGLNILLYNRFGIIGLGYAYILWYLFYLAEVWVLCKLRYHVTLSRNAIWLPILIFLTCVATTLCREHLGWWSVLPFVATSLIFSAIMLRRLLKR